MTVGMEGVAKVKLQLPVLVKADVKMEEEKALKLRTQVDLSYSVFAVRSAPPSL